MAWLNFIENFEKSSVDRQFEMCNFIADCGSLNRIDLELAGHAPVEQAPKQEQVEIYLGTL